MAELSPLRRRMIEDMTIRNMSPATQRSYISAVSKFSRYFGRSPDKLTLDDVHAFQVHLVSSGISWPGLNQIVCALRFFYGVTLGEAAVPERIPYAREPRKLPIVLSADEVVRFLEAVSSLKSRAALTTAYAAGLRASEVAGLRVEDVDSGRGVILVRHGKGAKDRNVMLSPQLLGILRTYWRLARPKTFVVPGRDDAHSIDPTVLHAACRSAVKAAGLTKRVTLHTLRHSFATHLLGERNRHPDHPGSARPQQSVVDGALHAGRDPYDPRDAGEPVRSSDSLRGHSSGLDGRAGAWQWERAGTSFGRPTIEVADVLRRHGEAYRLRPRRTMWGASSGASPMSAIPLRARERRCSVVHVEACDDCGAARVAYHSCRNRHCPKCQGRGAWAQPWLAARQAELLAVPYVFHVVFTLPAPIAAIAFQNKAVVYADPVCDRRPKQ